MYEMWSAGRLGAAGPVLPGQSLGRGGDVWGDGTGGGAGSRFDRRSVTPPLPQQQQQPWQQQLLTMTDNPLRSGRRGAPRESQWDEEW